MAERRVGTSGWSYDHWRGNFYPADLAKGKELEHYATVFDTVELNSSFYHLPKPKTARNWHERTPRAFVFAVKGSRYITHRLKLADASEPVQRLVDSIKPLAEKTGPILWQLSPGFACDQKRLASFLELKPPDQHWACEFRHESWFCPDVYELLAAHNCALVWADTPNYPLATIATADFIYARLHGHSHLYVSDYDDEQLRNWAQKLLAAAGEDRDIFAYFDNDAKGHAPKNALTMRQMLAQQ